VVELPTISKLKFGVGPVQFLKEAKTELKKVKWPTKNEVVKMTTIVIGISVVVSLFISGLDFVFTKLAGLILK